MATSTKFDFRNRRGELLAGRLELPATRPRAYAVFAHCFTCSKNIKAARLISRALCAHGVAVLRFDFTGLGNSEGDFANTGFSSNVEDLVDASNALGQEHATVQLLVGHSLGGTASLAAAGELPGVRAVATIGAPSEPAFVVKLLGEHLPEIEEKGLAQVRLAGRPFTIKRQFIDDVTATSIRRRLASLRRALLLYHSPTDNIVGIDQARMLYDSAKHPKSFIALDSADHLLTNPDDAQFVADTLVAWVGRYLEEQGGKHERDAGEGDVVVEEIGEGYAQRIRAGAHETVADEPAVLGGTDAGMTPYDLLLASLGSCTSITLRMYANRKQWPVKKIAVRLRHERIHAEDCQSCETKVGRIDRIARELIVDGPLDDQQRARLLEIAEKCPVHRTLLGEKVIVTSYADE